LVIEGQYVRIILSKYLVAFRCILILYAGLDAKHINTEFPAMKLLFLE